MIQAEYNLKVTIVHKTDGELDVELALDSGDGEQLRARFLCGTRQLEYEIKQTLGRITWMSLERRV